MSDAMKPFPPYSTYAIPGDQQVEFKWVASVTPDIVRYRLFYAKGQGGSAPTQFDSANVGETSRVITSLNGETLKNDSVYLFGVTGVDADGNMTDFGNHMEAVPTVKAGNMLTLGFGEGSDYIAIPKLFNAPSAVTVQAWFKTTSTGDQTIFYHGSGGELQLYLNGGSIGASVKLSDYNWYDIKSPSPFNSDQWYHAAMTWTKAGQLKLYVNGHLEASMDVPDYDLINPGSEYRTTIGGYNQGGGSQFYGSMDEMSIWNVALSQSEIRSNIYGPLRGDETGLVALYHFNEPDANYYLADGVHNKYNGEFNGNVALESSGAMTSPLPPGGFYATTDTNRVKLHWDANFESNFSRYRIFVSDLSDFSNILRTDSTSAGNVNDTTKIISGLTNFTKYYFRIAAVLTDGSVSEYTPTIDATPSNFIEVPNTGFAHLTDGNFQWADYDNDGDYDVAISGSTDEGNNPPYLNGVIKLYRRENSGSFTEILNTGFDQEIHLSALAWCDYNSDGRPDLSYSGSSGNGNRTFKLYKNNGDGTFTDIPVDIQGTTLSAFTWGDYDNDGDQDVFIMGNIGGWSSSNSSLYRNDGNGVFTAVDIGIPGYTAGSCAWGDYDRDNDLDLLVLGSTNNHWSGGGMHVFRNDGNDSFSEIDNGEGSYFPSNLIRGRAIWFDYDNDGDIDIAYVAASGEGTRKAGIFANDGEGGFYDIGAGLTGLAKSTVSTGDYDNDGDMDLFFSGTNSDYGLQSYLARNDGENTFTMIDAGLPAVTASDAFHPASAFVDYDRDGDLDLMIEGYTTDSREMGMHVTKLFENKQSAINTPPSDPTGLDTTVYLDEVTLSWNKSTDTETPQNGLTYNIRVGTTSTGVDIVSPMAKVVGNTNAGGFRYIQEYGNVGPNNSWTLRNLRDGNYFWSVEAIDQTYRNSKFQTEARFTIDGVPSAPDSISVTAGVNAVTLRWSAKNKSDVTKYYAYVSTDNEGYTLIDSTTSGIFGTTITVTKDPSGALLQNGTFYYFRISAVDHNGYLSPFSNYVTAIPSATPGKWFVVNTNNSGPGSLRSAIDSTNLSSQKDTVAFLIPMGSNITLYSQLPSITTDFTVIDADSNKDGHPDITLSTDYEGGGYFTALSIESSNNLIRGLVIGGFGDYYSGGGAMYINGDNNRILGNYIGVSADGMSGNGNAYGIRIDGGSNGNQIGDATGTGRNIIGNNQQYGIYLDGGSITVDNTKILGNYIGIAADGLTPMSNNGPGISIYYKAKNTMIGDATAEGRNIISGNSSDGILITDDGGHISGTQILGNYIGTDVTGLVAVGNSNNGIYFNGYSGGCGECSIINSMIGDGTAGGRNVISGNSGSGIYFYYEQVHDNTINGNYIGVAADGSTVLANSSHGIYLYRSSDNTIKNNIVSGNSSDGILIDGGYGQANNNIITGNMIGTDATGTTGAGNGNYGIYLQNGASYNQIGGTAAGESNVISGNQQGGVGFGYAYTSTNYNSILGNKIGTNATGLASIPNNYFGIYFDGSLHNYNNIGDGSTEGRNIISGNAGDGIYFSNGASDNQILGNYIGVDATGNAALPNDSNGIAIYNASRILIGNESVGGRNIISGNGKEGIAIYGQGALIISEGGGEGALVNALDGGDKAIKYGANNIQIRGNYIGVGADGTEAIGNSGAGIEIEAVTEGYYSEYDSITANIIAYNNHGIELVGISVISTWINNNTIYSNSEEGIVIEEGAQDGITAPIITSVNNFVISGTATAGATVNIFQDATNQGRYYLGSSTADAVTGDWTFSGLYHPGYNVTATQFSNEQSSAFSSTFTTPSGTLQAVSNSLSYGDVLAGDSATITTRIFAMDNPVVITSGALVFGTNVQLLGALGVDTLYMTDTISLQVRFKPVEFGFLTDTLRVLYGNNNRLDVRIGGTGTAGTLASSGEGFAMQTLNGDSTSVPIQLYTTSGWVSLTSTSFAQNNYFTYTLDKTLPYTLKPGDTANVFVKFKPTTFANSADTLNIVNNSAANPFQLLFSGLPQPGTIAAASPLFSFGNVLVGDSLSLSKKIYATSGRVQIDGSSLVSGGQIDVTFSPALPFIVSAGDTVILTAKYKPTTFTALTSDTVYILSNASNTAKLGISMNGNGQTGTLAFNTTPANFGSIRVADSSTAQIVKIYSSVGQIPLTGFTLGSHFKATTATAFPVTVKSGDTISLSVKFKPQTTGALLDTIKIGNVRVPLAGTGLENVAPTLTLGVTSVIALKQYLGIYMYSSETLSARTAAFKFNDATVTAPTFDAVSGVNNLYYAQYKLSAAGSLKIDVTGTDIAGNVGTRSKTYTIGSLTKDQTLAVEAEGLRINGSKGAIGESGFMVITRSQNYEGDPVGLAKGLSETTTDFTNTNMQSWDIVSTVTLDKSVTLTAVYDETWISALQAQYANFDERKIGFYREENGSLVYQGGEGRNGSVSLQTKSLGKVVIQYNDEHRFLPTEITLGQNYPNPFNPTTTIEFGLPEASHVKLVVYNILGQRVAELFNGQQNEGYHKFVWNGRNAQGATVSSGVYLYRLETNKGSVTKKMMFLK